MEGNFVRIGYLFKDCVIDLWIFFDVFDWIVVGGCVIDKVVVEVFVMCASALVWIDEFIGCEREVFVLVVEGLMN